MNENNNEPREMTQEELDKIVGGYVPTRPRMPQQLQTTSGIPCSICGNIIPVSVQHLLYERSLRCPTCGLSMFIDKKKADKALKILEKVDRQVRELEK